MYVCILKYLMYTHIVLPIRHVYSATRIQGDRQTLNYRGGDLRSGFSARYYNIVIYSNVSTAWRRSTR